jgi:hypothetical protein
MNPNLNRLIIIEKASQLYIETGKTRNITEALRLYLENDAGPDEQIPLFITTPEIHQVEMILKQIRPTCDECSVELYLQVNSTDPAGRAWPTAWVCKNCGIEYYSEKTPAEWLKELERETRDQNLRKPDEPLSGNVPTVPPGTKV